jgi:hypothetical protein
VRRLLPCLALATLLALGACSEATNGTGMISQRIGEMARDPEAHEVDLAKLTTFGWDRFYFFAPGTSREDICKFIGANRNNCGRVIRYAAVPSDSVTLVFALGGQLTHTELHALANGQFDITPGDAGIRKQAAVFRIRRNTPGTGRDRVFLEPK